MIVQCGNCQTRFRVADDRVTPRGIKVRCSRCQNVFVVRRGGAPGASGAAAEVGFPASPAPPGPLPATRVADPGEVLPSLPDWPEAGRGTAAAPAPMAAGMPSIPPPTDPSAGWKPDPSGAAFPPSASAGGPGGFGLAGTPGPGGLSGTGGPIGPGGVTAAGDLPNPGGLPGLGGFPGPGGIAGAGAMAGPSAFAGAAGESPGGFPVPGGPSPEAGLPVADLTSGAPGAPPGRLDPAPAVPTAAPTRAVPLPTVAAAGGVSRYPRRRDRAPAGGIAAVVHVALGLLLLLALGVVLAPSAPGDPPGAGLLRLVAGGSTDPDLVPVEVRSVLREAGPNRRVLVVAGAIERRRGPEGPVVVTAELVAPDGGVLARGRSQAEAGTDGRHPFRLVIAELPPDLDRAGLRIIARPEEVPPAGTPVAGEGVSAASSP